MVEQLFFDLIRVSIGTKDALSRIPSKREWSQLYDMAVKQSLVGVCFAGVQKCLSAYRNNEENLDAIGIPEMLYLSWMGMSAKIQQQNEKINRQSVVVQKTIGEAGFRTYIMKGQGNAALYGKLSLLRQSGDIDIFLDGGFGKVLKFVNDTYPTNEVNELEIHYHCLPDTDVEIHYRPFIMRNPFKNRQLQRFFENEGEKCFENKVTLPNGAGEITVPTLTFNLVHQLVHIHLHLYTEGVGMRQLMDYYFVLRYREYVKECKEETKNVIHELGLDRFASALMWVIKTVFVGDEEENVIDELLLWKPNEKDGRFLLNEIMLAGNFGRYDELLNVRKSKLGYGLWSLLARNLSLYRFDYSEWFWGPLWRVYYFTWRKVNGYK